MSTRQWSTGTLDDGVRHVSLAAKAETVEETESDLERQLQDWFNINSTIFPHRKVCF